MGIAVPEMIDLFFLPDYASNMQPRPEPNLLWDLLFPVTFIVTRSALGIFYLEESWDTLIWSLVEYLLWQLVLFLIWYALRLDLYPSKDYS